MGNYLSFASVDFENGEIPLADGEYRGYYEFFRYGGTERVLSFAITHKYKKYMIKVYGIKGRTETAYCNFKIENKSVTFYGGIMGQGWTPFKKWWEESPI